MNEQDRQAIDGLFSRLAETERQAGPKDAEADAFIKQRVAGQPGAPYMMAQTIVMQNFALEQAQQRISQLEEEIQNRPANNGGGGGFLGGLFGGGSSAPSRSTSVPTAGQSRGYPGDSPMQQQGGYAGGPGQPGGFPGGPMQQAPQGGGFLAGAAQTAMGVAGGVLVANAVGSMFGGGAHAAAAPAAPAATPAPAAEPAQAQPAQEPAQTQNASADDNNDDDNGGGGFFDDMFGGDDMDV
ncbi:MULTISPECIES: DUF2076 domain-containing protein [Rhodomicrobium]|uniref:DUF2076 domain-containing protein n=1 Tax=Rhodomicrobium TaxID=1068 RepID=UPI000B4BFA53|nr:MULTISPECIES: DUF2076 domain-containing protein [Rhodomicrobium]